MTGVQTCALPFCMWTGVVKSIDRENKTVKVGVVGMYGSETVLEVSIDKVETY